MMELVSGDNWSYETCKVPVELLTSTKQHPVFSRLDALPVARGAVSRVFIYNTKSLIL